MDKGQQLELLGDECCREILEKIKTEPKSVKEINEECSNISMPTVYRRINKLMEFDIITESTAVDLKGSHNKTYKLNLKGLEISMEDDGLEVDFYYEEDDLERVKKVIEKVGPRVEDISYETEPESRIVADINSDEIRKLFKPVREKRKRKKEGRSLTKAMGKL
ncbi:MAG: hypothetical protein ABEK59_02175 [Halobacteria archaeon]